MNKRSLLAGISIAAFGCGTPFHVQAQTAASADGASDTLEEIIVTAERRSSDMQKTAVSVAVRDGNDLMKQGKSSLAQILEDVPGVTVPALLVGASPNDNPGGGVVIRGVAPNAVLSGDTGVATTALYTDGVYQGIGGDFDIDRVEVLRGPQGTLYGRSATGGVVATYTRDPKLGQWGADVNLEYGSYALQHASAAVNVAAGDTLAVRISGNTLYQNTFWGGAGRRSAGSHEENAGRVKVLYQPSDDLSLLLGFAAQGDIIGQGGPSVNLTSPNTIVITQGPSAPAVTDTFHQYWAQLNWNLGFGTLTYMPALRNFASDSPSVLNALPFFLQNISNDYKKDQIHTEELRLASNADSAVKWIVGGWFYNRDYDYDETVVWEPSGGFSHEPHIVKKTTNSALFGETTLPLSDTWRVTAGVRYDRTHTNSQNSTYTFNASEGSCSGNPFNPPACTPTSADWALPNNISTYNVPAGQGIRNENNFTYKLRLEKDVGAASLFYAMVSSGFLPGDLSVGQSRATAGGPLQLLAFDFSPEKQTSFELGSKNRFFNNKLQVNGAAYYYDYKDYQTIINLNPGTPAPYFVVASSPAKMYGAELETLWQATSQDRLGLSLSYTHARYVDKPPLFAAYVAEERIPGITPLTAQGQYDHKFALPNGSSLDFGADALYTSSNDQNALAPSRLALREPYVRSGNQVVANARLTWSSSSGKYSVTGYVRNVTDNVYKTGANDNDNVTPSAPRVYGLALHASVD